jgi:hypothetical protein
MQRLNLFQLEFINTLKVDQNQIFTKTRFLLDVY